MRSDFQGAWIDKSGSRGFIAVKPRGTCIPMKSTDTLPDWWPNGCDESIVRDCNCSTCEEMIAALEEYRNGQAPDGENKTLEAYL